MTTPDMDRYCNVMEDVKGRIIAIDLIGTPAGQAVPVVVRIESIYLQYRKILELFAFASLLTAPEKYAQVYEAFSKQRDAAQLLQALEQANPDFYPKPKLAGADGKAPADRTSGFLTREDFAELHRRCSEIAYARDPLAGLTDFDWYMSHAQEWRDKIIGLLDVHATRLAGTQDWQLVSMQGGGGKVASVPFDRAQGLPS
jgi:hypothetical protein